MVSMASTAAGRDRTTVEVDTGTRTELERVRGAMTSATGERLSLRETIRRLIAAWEATAGRATGA